MQFTGPLMAKGVEDTLMYTFNRFVGHNDVGDSPEFFGLSVADLKFVCPGVPDTYQGTTSWELTLVDPDNRRGIVASGKAAQS